MEEQSYHFRDVRIQGVGSVITEENKRNIAELYKSLHRIDYQSAKAQQVINDRLEEALGCIDNVFDFVGSPESILGSQLTKHGEIAEHVDVEFHNAWNVMKGKAKDATFENVGRTAPEDYIVDGVAVQSKYINGSSNSLSHVLKHLDKYKDISFGRNGSYYVIPKDQFSQIKKVLSGDTTGLSEKTIRAIKDKVSQIEVQTGHSFFDVVKPGHVDYAEVQQGRIHKTLHKETKKLRENAQEQKDSIDAESQKQRDIANEKAKPSWHKAATAAGISAGISGGLQLAFGIQRKCKQGKKIQDFTVDDWKDIGLDTTKAAAEGGVSGLAIYGMTNFANVPSPIAAAGISLSFGLVELTHEYCCHRITKADFTNGCQTICINSVISAVGAFVGERLIPIPVLGSIIGSAIAGNIGKELLGQGLHDAILNASLYVHGSTVSMLDAAKEMSYNHMVTTRNIGEIQEIHTQIAKDTEEFFLQMRGLL